MNFWASWCGPCEAEAPDLMRIYDKLKDKLDIYAVNVTKGDNLKEVKEFLDQYPYPFPVLLDKEGKAAELYQVQVIPTSFLVDRNGVIVDVIHYLPGKELEKKLKEFADS
ncbi:TlpA family protein disulfide reductase [Paenibacillus sp. CC-CFT747]|nr:TlpA family protein disulfide reductase [Paenibacillus sp. CC-CFT747]